MHLAPKRTSTVTEDLDSILNRYALDWGLDEPNGNEQYPVTRHDRFTVNSSGHRRGGPTGITAAILLALQGVPSLVIERWEDIYPQPRAVHLDDEVYRILESSAWRTSSQPSHARH